MAAPALKHLDFFQQNNAPTAGLVSVQTTTAETTLAVDERVAVSEAAAFEKVDYVFFRRFSDGRSSLAAAYVVDNSDEHLDEKSLADLHRKLWLNGTVPLLYVAWATRVDVLSCIRGPDFWNDAASRFSPAESIDVRTAGQISSELEKRARLSAFRLADGTLWDDPRNAHLANHDKGAHKSLIQAVVETDRELEGHKSPLLRRLLLLMVLIKYLEDRRVFPSAWFGRFQKRAKQFSELLQGGDPAAVKRLLRFLERRFNGDVFVLTRNGGHELTKSALKRFAQLVEARTLGQQRYLWDQFSFEHVPVEVISSLYQRFVEGGHGTVYTPPFLASLLLDRAMPYAKLSGDERVLDPACGSGVFLVGAFRRLVNVWRSRNGWQRPDVETLKGILRRSIFGIELDPDAIDLSAFSLALAVCDALKPEVIWKDLKFEPFRNANLFQADFFELILRQRAGQKTTLEDSFDVVVGNPPFESALTEAGAALDKISESANPERGVLPDKQAAYLFLEQALTLVRPRGRLCLIQPHGVLYNRKTDEFRASIFRKNRIDSVFDFTSIRKLYEADPKTVALFAGAGPPDANQTIEHLTFRRTTSVHQRICFELDHYDRHRVSQPDAESEPFVWRSNLLGGGRLLEVSQRLRQMRTLAEFVEQNVDQRGWDYGEGFIAATTGKRERAQFLIGKPFLPTTAFTDAGIDESQIGKVNETHFRSAYTEARYSPPLILVKESASLPFAFWDKGFLAYRDKIIGIHAPVTDRPALQKLYNTFRRWHKTYQFCCALNGTQALLGKATAILKQDVDALPYPADEQELQFSFWEEGIQDDVLSFMADYVRLGQNSELITKTADASALDAYCQMFCRMLGSVYRNLCAADPVRLDALICQPFYFGERPESPLLRYDSLDQIHRLVYQDQHESLRTVRIVRFYADNVMLIIKPDRLRYWIRSTAIRDADETLVDLYRQGY
jgi:SAM-dependent methyltransferase